MNFDSIMPALNVAGFCEWICHIAKNEDQCSVISYVQKVDTAVNIFRNGIDGAVRRCQTLNFFSLLKNDLTNQVESRWYHNCSSDTRGEPGQNK